ncbi:hypothetical protein [Halobacterium jilantaiense]|uniref:Uncharacterized protein n=1 Tax=Halobacterium jilantaiense TaxID=355548 RepID=A0A1I0NBY9_9EURY|nr:hypothetical protein [Halobacterium jilantaiense]SEV98584.1 hypothetical protein SAMN04487945_0746 [Halobacterium jilantaiense]
MDWRVLVAGFVVCVGLVAGWSATETVGGAVSAAGLISALFAVGWLVDRYVYGL